jgi:hypothetical protein
MWYVVTMLPMVVWCLLWVLAHWGPYCELFPFVKSMWLARTLRLREVSSVAFVGCAVYWCCGVCLQAPLCILRFISPRCCSDPVVTHLHTADHPLLSVLGQNADPAAKMTALTSMDSADIDELMTLLIVIAQQDSGELIGELWCCFFCFLQLLLNYKAAAELCSRSLLGCCIWRQQVMQASELLLVPWLCVVS